MTCQVCLSSLKAGDLFCSFCGAAVADHAAGLPRAAAVEARGRIAGERKYLTVLCADLQRSTDLISDLDPEEAISRLEPALVAMRVAVRRNRGIVSKEGGDGLIALFGAPHADDNHAVMACHAAVDLVRRIQLLNDPALHVRVGLHSGYVVTHTIEADLSSIYEAGGPAVHLVKRFESAAQAGQILVSESCQHLSAGLVTFKSLPPRRMEGFVAPVPCYELIEISGLSRWRARSSKGLSSFVGRAEETALLERAAREAATSSGQAIAVLGTAGVGKSRVAHEFVEDLRQKDWQVLDAECSPLDQAVPYSLLKKLVHTVLRAAGLSPDEIVPSRDVSADAGLWPTALRAVLDLPNDDPRWNELEPLLRRRVIIDAVRALIGRVTSARPTVLLLEDLHWIDSQSEAAVEALMPLAVGRPLLMLLTWRTEDSPGWLSKLDVRRVWLRSLDMDSAGALLDSLIGKDAGLAGLKSRILRHTGQIPLFIEEVARQLMDRGVVTGSEASRFAEKAQWDALEIPPTIQGVIASRIDRLSKEDKALLQLASVIGPRIPPHLLAGVTGIPLTKLQSRLWSLEILDFLCESRYLSQIEYVFAHDLVREVAYDSILRSQREVLHRRILAALEASKASEEDIAESLCHHAVKAQDWGKADRYGHLAAKKAFARSAFRDATEYYRVAMDAVDKQPETTLREQRAIDLRLEARLAFVSFGSIEEWFSLGRDGEERAERIGDEGRRLASLVIRAAALNFYGTPYEALAAGEQAVELANKLNNANWLVLAEYGLGQSFFLAGRFRDSERWLGQASVRLMKAPENVPPGTTGSSLLVLCQMMRATSCSWLGEFDEAERCSRLASELAERNDRPYDLVAASYGYGVVQMQLGNVDEAEMAFDRALRISRESEVRLFLPPVLTALGNIHLQRGRTVLAHEILLQAKNEAEAVGHQTSMVAVSPYLGTALSNLGNTADGLALTRASQAGAKQKGYGPTEALAHLAEAGILSSLGPAAIDDAIASAQRTVEIADRLEAGPLKAIARGMLCRLYLTSGRTTEARGELVQAIAQFSSSKMTVHLERAKATLSTFSDSP